MSGFEHYAAEARSLEAEIQRTGIALGVDWSDEAQVRALAREALEKGHEQIVAAAHGHDRRVLAKAELFGLTELMLKMMLESEHEGIHTQGGPVWQAFGRALLEEAARIAQEPGGPPETAG